MLVCPGHEITTPLPNALRNPALSASRKPLPYDSSITTDTMPQEIPSIARPARKRLRARPNIASRNTSTSTCMPLRRMAVPATAGRSSVEVVKPSVMRYISYRSASTGGISAARRAG